MKLILAAAIALAAPTAVLAQAAPAQTPAPAAGFSIDTPIETLVAHEGARAVLERHLPGVTEHPAYDQFKSMSLKAVAPYSQGLITPEKLTAIDTDLKALPAG